MNDPPEQERALISDESGSTTEAIEVVVPDGSVELVSDRLWMAGVTAIAEHPAGPGQVLLRTDVPSGGLGVIEEALTGTGLVADLVVVENDGLDAWRTHAAPSRAGQRLVIRPPWVPLGPVAPDEVVIQLDPGRSWGHGAHPTTRLCLAEVERQVLERPGRSVLDVGCGSGALAIAAARLGATRVMACDIDPAAIEATEANAMLNGVEARIEVVLIGEPQPQQADPLPAGAGHFDLIVANIGATALVELAPHLVAHLADGGTLVVSGLLDPIPASVMAAFEPLRLIRTEIEENWVAAIMAA